MFVDRANPDLDRMYVGRANPDLDSAKPTLTECILIKLILALIRVFVS